MLCSLVLVVLVVLVDNFPGDLEEFWFVVAYIDVSECLYNALMSFNGRFVGLLDELSKVFGFFGRL